MSALANSTNRRASLQPVASDPTALTSPMVKQTRPASSLATHRRVSLLPQPRGRQNSAVTGRESPQAIAGAASALRNSSQTSSENKGKDKKPLIRLRFLLGISGLLFDSKLLRHIYRGNIDDSDGRLFARRGVWNSLRALCLACLIIQRLHFYSTSVLFTILSVS
jgi:hypothetical protein